MTGSTASAGAMRIDKWLWAARFYKTRALASAAVSGGKVQVGGERVKPSRRIAPGDSLVLQKGPYRFLVTIEKLSSQRRPAAEARELYRESAASVAQRHALYAERRLQGQGARQPQRRPDKRTRRLIHKFKQQL